MAKGSRGGMKPQPSKGAVKTAGGKQGGAMPAKAFVGPSSPGLPISMKKALAKKPMSSKGM